MTAQFLCERKVVVQGMLRCCVRGGVAQAEPCVVRIKKLLLRNMGLHLNKGDARRAALLEELKQVTVLVAGSGPARVGMLPGFPHTHDICGVCVHNQCLKITEPEDLEGLDSCSKLGTGNGLQARAEALG
jgi:hypothetical protein